nr:RNA-dependent RNA polymerase [Aphid bunyavirus 1]
MDDYMNVVDYHDPEACATEVSSLIFKRHEVACVYVHNALYNVVNSLVTTDANIHEWLRDNNFNPIDSSYKKTPDLVFLHGRTIYVGDIAVSKTHWRVEAIKSKKYNELRLLIQASNGHIDVEEFNIIFDENGTNISDISNRMRNQFNGGWSALAAKALKAEFNMCLDKVQEIYKEVHDYGSFTQYLTKKDKNDPGFIDTLLDQSLENELVYDREYEPSFAEEELFHQAYDHSKNQIKNMDSMSNINDLNDVREKLDKVVESSYDKKEIRTPLQYVFNLENTEEASGLSLIQEYYQDIILNVALDDPIRNEFLSVLPHGDQLAKMMAINEKYRKRSALYKVETTEGTFSDKINDEFGQRLPYFSAEKGLTYKANKEDNRLKYFIARSTRVNEAERPKSIMPKDYPEAIEQINHIANYLSMKNTCGHTATNLTFDIPSGRRKEREAENVGVILPMYNDVNSRNGVILLSSIVKWIQDIVRVKIGSKKGIYYSVPIQRTMIMCTLTGNSMYGNNPHYNYFSLARFKCDANDIEQVTKIKKKIANLFGSMVIATLTSAKYIYIMSKLQKTTLDKLEKIVTVDYEMRAHAICMGVLFNETVMMNYTSIFKNKYHDINKFKNVNEYMNTLKSIYDRNNRDAERAELISLDEYYNNYIGPNCLIMADLHQKPSEILDLMKYLSGINFSELSSIRKLLVDKLSMMRKTSLDVYLIDKVIKFCERNIRIQRYCKPSTVLMAESGILPSSYNVTGLFSSFWHEDLYTSSLNFYYSEAQLIFQARPKKLYNEQYMVKACLKVLNNNKKYEEEEIANKYACSEGRINGKFDFSSSFNYSRDAVFYAQSLMNKKYRTHCRSQKLKIAGKLQEIGISNVSMRGSCKLEENMKAGQGKSQTSLYSCLEYLEPLILSGDSQRCKLIELVRRSKNRRQCFNMSSKEQRGGGRPIGSPDYPSKQELYLVESVYKILSTVQNENLLVKGVNRSAKIASINKSLISTAYSERYKVIRHIVMDQSQFSEGDNVNKFCDFIWFNDNIPSRLKGIMINLEKKHMDRHQYWPLMPKEADDTFPGMILTLKGTKGKAGWVQGMKNIISTYAHISAVTWIADIFNKYYFNLPENIGLYGEHKGLIYEQIVNSDDSYIIVAFKDVKPIHDFYSFMISAKRYFRLEQNEKKSYITGTIGEIIQKYVANGTIINIWSKLAVSSFRNNMGVDMARDVSNSVSVLGSLLREGAPETICTYLRAELKNQIYRLYNIGDGKFNDMKKVGISNYRIPCEMGGWPTQVTTYELCVAGLNAQLEYCKSYYDQNPDSNELKLVRTSIQLNMMRFTEKDVWDKVKEKYNANSLVEILEKQSDGSISKVDMRNCDDVDKALKFLSHVYLIDQQYIKGLTNEVEEKRKQLSLDSEVDLLTSNDFNISNEGISSYDGSFARSTVSCINWIISVPKRVSRTLNIMKRFEHLEPSGLAGLYKERMDIKVAVADLLEQSNSMIIKLSEMNYTKSTRQKAASNAFASTQRCCSIAGVPYKMTILGVFNMLIKLSDRMKYIFTKDLSISFVRRVLSDPTSRAPIARDITYGYEKEGTIDSEHYIANKLPRSEDDIELYNDIQSVLVEMVRPGYLKDQGYVLRYEERLQADIRTIKMIYKDWLDISNNMTNTVRTIYFHYISVKRSRYMIAPPLDTKNISDTLLSIYEKCQNISTRNIGVYRARKTTSGTVARTESTKMIIDNLMGAFEIILYLQNTYNITAKESASTIKIDHEERMMTLENFIQNKELFGSYYNLSTPYEKKYLALLANSQGDTSYLTNATKHNEFIIEWEKEQDYIILPTGEKQYTGAFKAIISKGDDAVCVEGEPEDINCIYTTTANIKFIESALFFFMKRVNFTNFKRPRELNQWGNSTFWNSRNKNSSMKLLYSRHGVTRIEVNNRSDIVMKKGLSIHDDLIKKSLQIAMDTNTDYVSYIPIEYAHNINANRARDTQYNEFKIIGNKVYGIKHRTIIDMTTNPLTGFKDKKSSFKEENCFLFSYKDAHRSSSYSFLNFGTLMVDDIALSSIAKYGMLKNMVLGELVKSPRRQIMEFIQNEVSPSMLIVEFIKMLVSSVTEVQIPSTLDATTSLATEVIGLDFNNSMVGTLTNMMSERFLGEEDMVDDDEDEYGGVNFKIDGTKSVSSILVELSMITIDIAKANMIVDTFLTSSMMHTIIDHATKILAIKNKKMTDIAAVNDNCNWAELSSQIETTTEYCYIDDALYTMFGMIIDEDSQSTDKRKRNNLRTLIVNILKSGLLSRTTWEVNSIKTKTTQIRDMIQGSLRTYKPDEYSREDDIESFLETQIIELYLNKLYKKRNTGINPDDLLDIDDYLSNYSGEGGMSNYSSRRGSVSATSSSGSLILWK